MGFLTAMLCAQALFVERFDAGLTDANWKVSAWNTFGGMYQYNQDLGAATLTYLKTDAGQPGNPPFLDHTFTPAVLGAMYLRYHLRFQQGDGHVQLWPIQLHYANPYGTVGELMVDDITDDSPQVLRLNGSDSMSFRPGPAVPISPGMWHLLQLDFEGLGTDAGLLSGALDGVAMGAKDFDWTQASGTDLLSGFPAVSQAWTGAFSVDNLVVLSARRAVFVKVRAPANTAGVACLPLYVDFTDLDGGPLPPPDVSVVSLTADIESFVFGDSFCGSLWTGTNITTSTVNASIGYGTAGPHTVTVASPDLIGETVMVAARDAGVPDAGAHDAGAPDAGIPDSGTLDAGAPDAGGADASTPDAGETDGGLRDAGTPDAGPQLMQRGYDVGCGCDAAPAGAGLLPLLLLRLRRRRK